MAAADFQRSLGCFWRAFKRIRSMPSGASGRKARRGRGGAGGWPGRNPAVAVETEIGVFAGQKVKQGCAGAVDVGGLADFAEAADVLW